MTARGPGVAARLFAALKRAFIHFNDSDGWAMSSHVALSLMMAVFPFLIFATSLAGFLGSEERAAEIVALVFNYWPEAIAEPITREIEVVMTRQHTSFLTAGIVLALVFASNGIEAVRISLSRAYQDVDRRNFWRVRLISLAFVLIGSALMLVLSLLLVVAPLYLAFIETSLPSVHDRLFTSQPLRTATAVLLLVYAVYAAHRWLPARRRRARELWPGIVLTLGLWVVAGRLFTAYLRGFADYGATYAGLAGIMTALIFLYLMAAILIFGAEFNAALAAEKRDGR